MTSGGKGSGVTGAGVGKTSGPDSGIVSGGGCGTVSGTGSGVWSCCMYMLSWSPHHRTTAPAKRPARPVLLRDAADCLALRVWFQAMQLLTQSKNNVSALELRRQLGVNYHSAWLLKHKIMQAMRLAEDDRELDGRVEIDDAYLGGERSGGKRGRGSENKVPFIAAVQTTPSGKPIVACLRAQPHTIEQVGAFAATHIAPTATVISDGLWCFRATALVGAEHQRVVTGGGKASVERPEFKAINTLLGNLKTAITGTYHAFDFAKYAHRYLAEFQFRFNRRFDLPSLFADLAMTAASAMPRPRDQLRVAYGDG